MSELVVLGLKLGFLALLWLFIIFTGNVIRTDLFGRKVSAAELARDHPDAIRLSRRDRKRIPTTLLLTGGQQAGLRLPLADELVIGRGVDCELQLQDDYASTRHARITRTPVGFQVEDLGSTNGTFLNDQRLQAPAPFGFGDVLRIGRAQMSVEK